MIAAMTTNVTERDFTLTGSHGRGDRERGGDAAHRTPGTEDRSEAAVEAEQPGGREEDDSGCKDGDDR